MTNRIVRTQEITQITGLSERTIGRMELAGDFPRRRKISLNVVGWTHEEISLWIESRQPKNVTTDSMTSVITETTLIENIKNIEQEIEQLLHKTEKLISSIDSISPELTDKSIRQCLVFTSFELSVSKRRFDEHKRMLHQ